MKNNNYFLNFNSMNFITLAIYEQCFMFMMFYNACAPVIIG